jgi:thiamine biosynthesis lipoprotein
VAVETLDLVERAIGLWHDTEHRFDPTVLRSLEARGYDETFERVRDRRREAGRVRLVTQPPGLPPMEFLGSPTPALGAPAPGCSGVVVDRSRGTIRLPPGVGLDLGGVGKGYAADLVARGLVSRGAVGACVGVGGDVRCAGVGPVRGGWDVEVEDPFAPARVLFRRHLREAAIVTSTRLFRRWRHAGSWQHHLIDPATGVPAGRGVAAVIVTDHDAWRAEGWAKAAFVAGPVDGLELLDRAGLAGWIVDDAGIRHVSTAAAKSETKERAA